TFRSQQCSSGSSFRFYVQETGVGPSSEVTPGPGIPRSVPAFAGLQMERWLAMEPPTTNPSWRACGGSTRIAQLIHFRSFTASTIDNDEKFPNDQEDSASRAQLQHAGLARSYRVG